MRICPVCSGEVAGRSDKIYCSTKCKSSAEYGKRISTEQLYLQIDKQLKRNRKLLKTYNKAGKATVRTEVLLGEGFNPKYFTHYWKNNKGEVYLFCYEYGFIKRQENNHSKFVLVQWQSYMDK